MTAANDAMEAISILLVTHDGIGDSLLRTAKKLLSPPPSAYIESYAVPYNCIPEKEIGKLKQRCTEIDKGAGVLLLTDLYGATPSNIAMQLKGETARWLVGGLNLAMLLKVLNYSHLDGDALARKAYEGARESVIQPW